MQHRIIGFLQKTCGKLRLGALGASLVLGSMLVLSQPGSVFADTPVSGNQSDTTGVGGPWTAANSPYVVTGDITVPAGQTLTLQPGVVIKFQSTRSLNVNGTLNGPGTAGQPILFTAETGTSQGIWRNIKVNNGATFNLANCTIEYAGYALSDYDPTIWASGVSTVTLNTCTIKDTEHEGLRADDSNQTVSLTNVTFQNISNATQQNSPIWLNNINALPKQTWTNLQFVGNFLPGPYVAAGTIPSDVTINGGPGGLNGAPLSFSNGNVIINAGATVTLTAGTVVRLRDGAINIGGGFHSLGSPALPVSITSNSSTAAPGQWDRLDAFSGSTTILSHTNIAYAGRGPNDAFWIREGAVVTMTNSSIVDALGTGIQVFNSSATRRVLLDSVLFARNGGSVIYITGADMLTGITWKNLTFTGNADNNVVIGGSGAAGKQYVMDGSPEALNGGHIRLNGTINLNAGSALTITPGTTIRWITQSGIFVQDGSLFTAIGTPTRTITVTSDVSPTAPSHLWDTLAVQGNTGRMQLGYCLVQFGGRGAYAAVQTVAGQMTVDHCTVRGNRVSGIGVSGNSEVLITNSASSGNGGNGIHIDDSGLLTATNVSLRNNLGRGLSQATSRMASLTDITIAENTINAISIDKPRFAPAVVFGSGTLDTAQVSYQPFEVFSALTFQGGTLTVTPGTVVKFNNNTGFTIDPSARLVALGTTEIPITFTTSGGVITPGLWSGITVQGQALLADCVINSAVSGLSIQNSNSVVVGCTLSRNSTAINTSNLASPNLKFNLIFSNTFGVRNNSVTGTVDARQNWWGSPTGPKHATNVGGTGDEVSNRVLFDPWLTAPTSALPVLTPNRGGASGEVTVAALAPRPIFTLTTQFSLTRTGQTPITGTVIAIGQGGRVATIVFDLTNAQVGEWNLRTATAIGALSSPSAFTVDAVKHANLVANLVGLPAFRTNGTKQYYLVATNRGNVDAPGGIIWFESKSNAVNLLPGDGFQPPALPDNLVAPPPAVLNLPTGKLIRLYVPRLGPGESFAGGFKMNIIQDGSWSFGVTTVGPTGQPLPPLKTVLTLSGTLPSVFSIPLEDRPGMQLVLNNMGGNGLEDLTKRRLKSCYGEDRLDRIRETIRTNPSGDGFAADALRLTLGGATEDFLLMQGKSGNLYAIDNIHSALSVAPIKQIRPGDYASDPAFQGINGTTMNFISAAGPARKPPENYVCEDNLPPPPPPPPPPHRDPDPVIIPRVPPWEFGPILTGGSFDPNAKVGPLGIGPFHAIFDDAPLNYAIYFENLATATAPAAEVFISDTLDLSKYDLSTFGFGPVSIGGNVVATPPPGLKDYLTVVDLRPGTNLLVRIRATLNISTGLATWRFTSLDPATGVEPENSLLGFLPPNVTAPQGEGNVQFTVRLKSGLPDATAVTNSAVIVFDANAPIFTPVWSNVIDRSAPTTKVNTLPATTVSQTFSVTWSGTDAGAGLGTYSIYTSKNGGAFEIWLPDTTDTSAGFVGEPGQSYAFYAIGRDGMGNIEAGKTTAEASTTVPGSGPTPSPGPKLVFVPLAVRGFDGGW